MHILLFSKIYLNKHNFSRLGEESPSAFDLSTVSSPTSIQMAVDANRRSVNADRDSTIRDDDCPSMTDMDPAMASLTQSLEDLDKEVEATDEKTPKNHHKPRLSLGGLSPTHQSPAHLPSRTGPGSVPLLASDEDLSSASQLKSSGGSVPLKKIVNRDSYSTVV